MERHTEVRRPLYIDNVTPFADSFHDPTPPSVVLAGTGKTFLVTGGTQGLGLVISAW